VDGSLDINARLNYIRHELGQTLSTCGRAADSVTILAAVKKQPPEAIAAAVAAGIACLGDNRLQESLEKRHTVAYSIKDVKFPVSWHFIGRLQSNKLGKIAAYFDCVQSVDAADHARKLSREAERLGKTLDLYIEIAASGEETKGGIPPERAEELAGGILMLPSVRVTGLMTVGPLTSDTGRIRACYQSVAELSERLRRSLPGFGGGLSMGMSGEWKIAVECGATMIRLGTSLFGSRSVAQASRL